VVGCNLGSALAYWIGARRTSAGGTVRQVVLMSSHDLDRMTWFFEKYGSITVLLARCMPMVQTFIAFPADRKDAQTALSHLYSWVPGCGAPSWLTQA